MMLTDKHGQLARLVQQTHESRAHNLDELISTHTVSHSVYKWERLIKNGTFNGANFFSDINIQLNQ